jgi:isocitrate/isopropylmalate dehydrogenase
MSYQLVLLPGDGIGPEVMGHARRCLDLVCERTGLQLAYQEIPCGGGFFLKDGKRDWPEGAEEACEKADLILLGAVGLPRPDGPGAVTLPDGRMAGWSAVIGNRTKLDLYANVRPVKCLPGTQHRIHGKHRVVWDADQVDMVIVRENTEGLYSGVGGLVGAGGKPHSALDNRVITRAASERVIRYAFELSRRRGKGAPKDGKKRVTCIAKDNVLYGCKLFVEVFRQIGAQYPDIEKDFVIVDAFTQFLLTQPEFYDVCVTTNMFGDIVTDQASVLQGGMGMAVGCNVGDQHGMFEPIHGSAPKHKPDQANPMAMILAAGAGLRWLGERKHDPMLIKGADAIEGAVAQVVKQGQVLTYDMIGEERASSMGRVADEIRALIAAAL